MPERIQLRRTKGWRMPPNTVKVDRATMWGNRWKVGMHSNMLGRPVATAAEAVAVYRAIEWPERHHHRAFVREILAGKNLACWCKLGEPCHADVLLEWANDEPIEVTVRPVTAHGWMLRPEFGNEWKDVWEAPDGALRVVRKGERPMLVTPPKNIGSMRRDG